MDKKVAIILDERDILALERAVIDKDREAALDFLMRAVKPQVDAQLNKGQCKPFFEWQNK